MARYICAQAPARARHAVAARHHRLRHRQRPADDVGRTILGPFAPQESVDALNQRLGTDRPLIVRYVELDARASSPSTSATRSSPASPSCPRSWRRRGARPSWPGSPSSSPSRSASPPASTPRRRTGSEGRSGDRPARRDVVVDPRVHHRRRSWSWSSASSSGWLPVLATPPPNADIPTQIRYLLMPATAMAIVYFGYIARMTRAGTIDVLQSDYTRTATMKGLTTSQTMRQPRPAQRARPDGRGHRRPGRLPVRRDHRGREDLQLQRHGRRRCCSRPSARTSRC